MLSYLFVFCLWVGKFPYVIFSLSLPPLIAQVKLPIGQPFYLTPWYTKKKKATRFDSEGLCLLSFFTDVALDN